MEHGGNEDDFLKCVYHGGGESYPRRLELVGKTSEQFYESSDRAVSVLRRLVREREVAMCKIFCHPQGRGTLLEPTETRKVKTE